MQKITPCLWFNNNGEEAMNFYLSVFNSAPDGMQGKVIETSKYPMDFFQEEMRGKFLTGTIQIKGHEFMILNAGPEFKFTEAVSFVIDCKDQVEVDYYWNKFTDDGGEESQCGWLKDKYGLSWQITPRQLGEMLADKDGAKASRVMNAMLQMKKIV